MKVTVNYRKDGTKILILNRKLKKDEKVTLLSDSTPDNWRGEDGVKLEGEWFDCSVVGKVNERPKICC